MDSDPNKELTTSQEAQMSRAHAVTRLQLQLAKGIVDGMTPGTFLTTAESGQLIAQVMQALATNYLAEVSKARPR